MNRQNPKGVTVISPKTWGKPTPRKNRVWLPSACGPS